MFFVNESLSHSSGVSIGTEYSKSNNICGVTLKQIVNGSFSSANIGESSSKASLETSNMLKVLRDSIEICRLSAPFRTLFSVAEA